MLGQVWVKTVMSGLEKVLGPAADDAGPGGGQDPLGPHAVLLLGHLVLVTQ